MKLKKFARLTSFLSVVLIAGVAYSPLNARATQYVTLPTLIDCNSLSPLSESADLYQRLLRRCLGFQAYQLQDVEAEVSLVEALLKRSTNFPTNEQERTLFTATLLFTSMMALGPYSAEKHSIYGTVLSTGLATFTSFQLNQAYQDLAQYNKRLRQWVTDQNINHASLRAQSGGVDPQPENCMDIASSKEDSQTQNFLREKCHHFRLSWIARERERLVRDRQILWQTKSMFNRAMASGWLSAGLATFLSLTTTLSFNGRTLVAKSLEAHHWVSVAFNVAVTVGAGYYLQDYYKGEIQSFLNDWEQQVVRLEKNLDSLEQNSRLLGGSGPLK